MTGCELGTKRVRVNVLKSIIGGTAVNKDTT